MSTPSQIRAASIVISMAFVVSESVQADTLLTLKALPEIRWEAGPNGVSPRPREPFQ